MIKFTLNELIDNMPHKKAKEAISDLRALNKVLRKNDPDINTHHYDTGTVSHAQVVIQYGKRYAEIKDNNIRFSRSFVWLPIEEELRELLISHIGDSYFS